MNIFVVHDNPIISAKCLDIKRKNKMLVESTQMLSTALQHYGYDRHYLYKGTHHNHPCNIWVRKNRSNFMWLFDYAMSLAHDFYERTGRVHKSEYVLRDIRDNFDYRIIPMGERTEFAHCATNYKSISNIFSAYRYELEKKWTEDTYALKFDDDFKKYYVLVDSSYV